MSAKDIGTAGFTAFNHFEAGMIGSVTEVVKALNMLNPANIYNVTNPTNTRATPQVWQPVSCIRWHIPMSSSAGSSGPDGRVTRRRPSVT